MQQLNDLRGEMVSVVEQCLQKHEGGESYFDELDTMVKSNAELMASYIDFIIQKENIHNIIVSGEIGRKMAVLEGRVSSYE